MKEFFNLIKYRYLITALVLRNIKVRYSQTLIGILWAVVQPLSTAIVFTVVFSKIIKVPTENIPYILFSYIGILPWSFFHAALLSAIGSIVSNATLVTRVYFPREIFPIVSIITAFVDFAIGLLGFFIIMFFCRVSLSITAVFVLPVFFIQLILTAGLGIFLSAINTFYRDVQHVIPYFLQMLMIASPIVYPVSLIPERFKTIYMLNPIAVIVDSYRIAILKGSIGVVNFKYLLLSFTISSIILVLSYLYFKKVEKYFADVI